MRVIIFGATGMIGRGALRECLLDSDVDSVLTVGRTATGQRHSKLREITHPDLLDLTPIEAELGGYDACFFCLGVTAAGRRETDYRRITYDYTLSAGRTLARLNPDLVFEYISGAGTDSTERGRLMWARVKGATENALLTLPFQAYLLRPGFIQPLHGIRSRTRLYQAGYTMLAPVTPLLRRLAPAAVTTTERLGRAMIEIVRRRPEQRVLGTREINALGGG